MQHQTIAPSVGESRLMNPDPYVPQDEPQGDKEQPQARIAQCRYKFSLAAFGDNSFRCQTACGNARESPSESPALSRQRTTASASTVCRCAGCGSGDSPHRPECPPAACRFSSCTSTSPPVVVGSPAGRSVCDLSWEHRPANFTGIKNGRFSPCKNSTTGRLKNSRSSEKRLIFSSISRIRSSNRRSTGDQRLVASHPGQGHGIAPAVLHDTGRGIGVKFRGPLFRLTVVDFVAAPLRLPVIGVEVQVDRDGPRSACHATREMADQGLVQTAFQYGERLGQTVLQRRHGCLIGRGMSQIAAGGGGMEIDRAAARKATATIAAALQHHP